MDSGTPPRPVTTAKSPIWTYPLARRGGIICGADSAGVPITCSPSFSCGTNAAGISSCQTLAPSTNGTISNTSHNTSRCTSSGCSTSSPSPSYSLSSYSTSTPGSGPTTKLLNSPSPARSTTGSRSKPVTASISPSTDTSKVSSSPTTKDPLSANTSLVITSLQTVTTKPTVTTNSGWSIDLEYSSLGSCTTHLRATSSVSGPKASTTATTTPNNTAQTVLPIVVPSFFIVICAIIFSIISNRRKRISRTYHARPLRRNLTDGSHAGNGSMEVPIFLRDLQTPPPAYSPYQFSQEDREWLGVANPTGTADRIERPESDNDMLGHAYPLGDRGRHRST